MRPRILVPLTEEEAREVRIIDAGPLIPFWAGAQAFGNRILLRQGQYPGEEFIAHELVHVAQWRQYGWLGFTLRYIWGLIRYRYKGHPLELQADHEVANYKLWRGLARIVIDNYYRQKEGQ